MASTPTHPLQQRFLQQMPNARDVASLFDFLPQAYFYAKNTQSQFTMGNRAFLNLLGVRGLEDVLGKTDRDFFVRPVADKYIAEVRAEATKIIAEAQTEAETIRSRAQDEVTSWTAYSVQEVTCSSTGAEDLPLQPTVQRRTAPSRDRERCEGGLGQQDH